MNSSSKQNLLPTGTRGRSWAKEFSFVPRDATDPDDNSPLATFNRIQAKIFREPLLNSKYPSNLPCLPQNKKNSSNQKQITNGAPREKAVKRDKESFRTTLVNIIMQNPSPNSRSSSSTNLIMDDSSVIVPTPQDKDMMQRYYYYISNGIDTNHVADMEEKWLENVLGLLPKTLRKKHRPTIQTLSAEMREDYHMSVKKAIVDFVLKDPRQKNDNGGQSIESAENFVRIRTSTSTWQMAFDGSYGYIKNNLLIINPTIVGIFELWNKFNDIRLFDVEAILTKIGSFELRTFKSM
ncbi:hypothetical protein HK096_010209, partial [Nowakowskiella sp. JEL0078]